MQRELPRGHPDLASYHWNRGGRFSAELASCSHSSSSQNPQPGAFKILALEKWKVCMLGRASGGCRPTTIIIITNKWEKGWQEKPRSRRDSRQLAEPGNRKCTTSEICSEKHIRGCICLLTPFALFSCLDLKGDWSQVNDSWRKLCKKRIFIYFKSWSCLFRMWLNAGYASPPPPVPKEGGSWLF